MTNEKAREILNILKEYERAYQYSKEEVVGALDMANKALEQTRWIPVSEGFPKHKDILVMDEGEDVFVAWYESEGLHEGWHSTDNKFDYYTPIIAWMPLPQSYKAESEE